ncbi:MAG: nucleotidyltransferase domain-containing protein [Candidatus Methanospirare jalkutatii]|nr:MAG: nucleotidyltransferase domain-containing protein [Candidatus Methanospirare jalkutatii]
MGSYARREQKETSDLDVIVEFEKRKSLLELVGIEQELEDKYKTKIVGKEKAEREKRR